MIISRFSRIDTVSWPGRYLSVIHIEEDGEGQDLTSIATVLEGDRDSIDGILVKSDCDRDPEGIPGLHTVIRAVRPKGVPVIIMTSGSNPSSLDDIIGAGYAHRAIFMLEDRPGKTQLDCRNVVISNDATFSVRVILDPIRMTADDVVHTAEILPGHDEFVIMIPSELEGSYKKKDLDAMSKSLRGIAKGVRIQSGFRRR